MKCDHCKVVDVDSNKEVCNDCKTNQLDTDRKCSRSACGQSIGIVGYRIWNQPHKYPCYRDYCRCCGQMIQQANSHHGDFRVEMVGDFRTLARRINHVKEHGFPAPKK